jgi:hypothetical protein
MIERTALLVALLVDRALASGQHDAGRAHNGGIGAQQAVEALSGIFRK